MEHSTNHASGANISIVLEHPTKLDQSLNWYASGIYVPSGSKRLISFNDPIHDSLYNKSGRSSFKTSLEDHQLKIIVSYPSSTKPYDGNFKIYSSKLRYRGFDGVGKYNTKDGLIVGGVAYGHGITDVDGDLVGYESGDRSAPLFAYGGTPVPSSITMNLVVSAATADQSLNLTLNHDPTTDMGDTAAASLFASGAVVTNTSMNLFTKTGPASGVLNLYLKQPNARSAFPQILPLEIKGAAFTYPYSQNTTSLFLQPSAGTGIFEASMILTMPFTTAPPVVDRRLLFIEGRQPKNEITLYLKSNEYLNGTLDLFMKTPGIGTPSGVMGLFAKQRNKTMYAPSSLTSNAAVVTSGTPPLFIKGIGFIGSDAGTQATGTVSITDTDALQDATIQIITTDGTVITATETGATTTTDTNSPTFEAGTPSSGSKRIAAAANLATCLNANSRLTATSDGYDCTITQAAAGASGNTTITLTFTASAGATKTDFTGGWINEMNLVIPSTIGSGIQTTTLTTEGF